MNKLINMGGKRFGRLLVIKYSHKKEGHIFWECNCDCGRIHITRGGSLRSGATKSCGCLRKEDKLGNIRNFKHGLTKHPLYGVWKLINRRCYDINDRCYNIYGGRGIIMCDEWKNHVTSFVSWAVENGWKKGLQIDRINNDGNYEPSNCRFVTPQENVSNSRLLRSTNKSGYRGVYWNKANKKWLSKIRRNGKLIRLGYFDSPRIAALRYDADVLINNDNRPYNFQKFHLE